MPKLANALNPPALILPKASETVASSASEVIKHNVELSPSAAAQRLQDEANALRREEAQTAYRQALVWGEFKLEVVKFLNERSNAVPR